jgi:glyoxylase-like metal-dependent hydrolase (beta-lactamase superfamily II)
MTIGRAAFWLVIGGLLAMLAPSAASAQPKPELLLWRLDCGTVDVPDLDFLSDSFAFSGMSKTVSVSCYLIRDGDRYLLWDTGLPLSRLGAGQASVGGGRARLARSIVDQLRDIGVRPDQIGVVALSHHHADHAGQAVSFPKATLLLGAEDLAVVRGTTKTFNLDRDQFAPWIKGAAPLDEVSGDRDIFGDGRVMMLATPGHTAGHHSLLVRLAGGPVILTGDLWHFAEQKAANGVPRINTSRADTLASMDRINRVAEVLHARIIIGHEPADIGLLPALPQLAR